MLKILRETILVKLEKARDARVSLLVSSSGFSYFCWFFRRMRDSRAAFLLCFYEETHDTNEAFRCLRVCRCDAMPCAMMWRCEVTRLSAVTGVAPDGGAARSGQDVCVCVCVYVLENSEGPAAPAWVSLGGLPELKSRKKKYN